MPTASMPVKSETSRQNGARSSGPITEAGKVRAVLNGVRDGRTGRTFFLLPDEDLTAFCEHEVTWPPPGDRVPRRARLGRLAIRAHRRETAPTGRRRRSSRPFGADGIEDADPRQRREGDRHEAARAPSCATGRRSRARTPPPCATRRPAPSPARRRRSPATKRTRAAGTAPMLLLSLYDIRAWLKPASAASARALGAQALGLDLG